ncbi:hypothetical protein [Embleya hyalina]|uniref:Uncharacterized protein n=1 Tax=Embleya hyalina TaxID=516124 RepID=A0A401YRD0_9ACTN|nr:hypothetical protein [Embleya hyalina]GCD97115.1 hypothetical protein EHYA_04803 [Embleya hyalina]
MNPPLTSDDEDVNDEITRLIAEAREHVFTATALMFVRPDDTDKALAIIHSEFGPFPPDTALTERIERTARQWGVS